MTGNTELCGLYAITDPIAGEGETLLEHVRQAINGGARIIQYRDKTRDAQRRLQEGRALLELCRQHGTLFIINDDVELAAQIGAHGVHIGQDDAALAQARLALWPAATIGVSCYNRLDLALQAQQAGADYVAFGRFFPSHSKPAAVQANRELLREAKSSLSVPIVAIGGITPDNGAQLIQHGADALAVIQGVFGANNITAAARRLADLFSDSE